MCCRIIRNDSQSRHSGHGQIFKHRILFPYKNISDHWTSIFTLARNVSKRHQCEIAYIYKEFSAPLGFDMHRMNINGTLIKSRTFHNKIHFSDICGFSAVLMSTVIAYRYTFFSGWEKKLFDHSSQSVHPENRTKLNTAHPFHRATIWKPFQPRNEPVAVVWILGTRGLIVIWKNNYLWYRANCTICMINSYI